MDRGFACSRVWERVIFTPESGLLRNAEIQSGSGAFHASGFGKVAGVFPDGGPIDLDPGYWEWRWGLRVLVHHPEGGGRPVKGRPLTPVRGARRRPVPSALRGL